MNYGKKKGTYDDDYSKIKPGYATSSKKKTESENQSEGFTDVIGTQKVEERSKALDSQQRYKAELDAQITAKKTTGKEGYSKQSSGGGRPLEELQQYGGYNADDQDEDYGAQGGKSSASKSEHKNKNLTEGELVRLDDQKRRQQEMKDYLDQQVQEKAQKKQIEKQRSEDHARQLQMDADVSKDTERQNQVDSKVRKESYAGELKKQIQTNQVHKKTSLW